MYGKTINESSRIESNFYLQNDTKKFQIEASEAVESNKINMKKNKGMVEINPIIV